MADIGMFGKVRKPSEHLVLSQVAGKGIVRAGSYPSNADVNAGFASGFVNVSYEDFRELTVVKMMQWNQCYIVYINVCYILKLVCYILNCYIFNVLS